MSNQRMKKREPVFASEVLATMSHELRSPLTSIKGYTTALLHYGQRLSVAERQQFLQEIDEASDHLALLLDCFLELSQLETGTVPFTPNPLQLVTFAREMLAAQPPDQAQQVKPQKPGPGFQQDGRYLLQFEDAADPSSLHEACVLADQRSLSRVFDQILENARLYAPESNRIDITIRPSTLSRDIPRLKEHLHPSLQERYKRLTSPTEQQALPGFEIGIRDYGRGIPHEHLKAIFERFYRVDTRLVREVYGLGLGLTICKHIIELHGGLIWAESDEGQGSIFYIWLPTYIQEKDDQICQEKKQRS